MLMERWEQEQSVFPVETDMSHELNKTRTLKEFEQVLRA